MRHRKQLKRKAISSDKNVNAKDAKNGKNDKRKDEDKEKEKSRKFPLLYGQTGVAVIN